MTGRRLVVVGGGVAGLAAARAAARAGAEVTLLETSDRLGGKVFTETVGGVPLEWGPDALVATKPRGRELLEELGLLEDAVAPATGRAYLLLHGELKPLPAGTVMGIPKGPGALAAAVRSGILSPAEAVRAAIEPALPGRIRPEETVGDVVRRRLGRGIADKLVMPLVENVYGSPHVDPALALPETSSRRSLIGAARRRSPVAFLGLRGGMVGMTGALAAEARAAGARIRTGTRVRGLARAGGGYAVRVESGDVEADAAILAVPGPAARAILRPLDLPERRVGRVFYSSSTVVHLRYPEGTLGRPLDGAGFVAAPGGRPALAACSWISAKWPHLDDAGPRLRAVARGAPSGAAHDALVAEVVAEVGRVMRAETDPDLVRAHRWPHALPEYWPGHAGRVAALRAVLPPGLEVAGASYDGVGIPDCVASGEAAAARVLPGMAG